jgi:hypothetical protein
VPSSKFEGYGFVSTKSIKIKIAADRALMEAARGLRNCQTGDWSGGKYIYDAL